MSKDAEPIVRMVDDFGAPSTNHELRIKEAQLHRALDRYLADQRQLLLPG